MLDCGGCRDAVNQWDLTVGPGGGEQPFDPA